MVSTIRVFRGGEALWSIEHDGGEEGVMDLTVKGPLPDNIKAVVARIRAEQAAEDPNGDEVDLMFDIPTEAERALRLSP